MKRHLFLLIISLCYFSDTFSQTLFKGKIFDGETNEPLIGASISIPGSSSGVVTNIDGRFELVIPESADSVAVSFIGYETRRIAVCREEVLIAMQPSVSNLQQIVVTANREAALRTEAPVAISKVSAMTISDTKPTLIAELVNKVPGVLMLNYNNEQHAMSIRQPMGTSAYFLYLEDGLPVRPLGIFNHNALIEMNVFGISSIEVVKGPVSSLYGPEAVGGAINFISHRPTVLQTVKVGVQGDQWGYKRVQYAAGGMIGEKVGVYLGGFEARQNNGWQSYSDYDKSSISARVDYVVSPGTKLIASISGNEYYSDMAGSVDSVAFYSRQYSSSTDFTYRKVHSQRIRFTASHQWNEKNETTATLAYRDNYIEQNPNYAIKWSNGSSTASGEVNRNAFYSKVALLQHSVKLNFLNANLIAGGNIDHSPTEYWAYKLDLSAQLRPDGRSVEHYEIVEKHPDVFLSNYQADLRNYAVYSQFEMNPHERLKVTVGGRFDRMGFTYENFLDGAKGEKSFQQFTPKVGATIDLLNDKGLYANYSQGFSPPALTAIFRKRPGTDSEFYYNLEPATFNNFEVGGWAAFFENRVYIDAAAYQMTGRKELLSVRQEDNSIDYQSAGKTLHRGIEYGLTYKPSSQWLFRFGGTNAIHRFKEFALSTRNTDAVKNVDGNEMPQAPRWIANTELTFKPDFIKGLRMSLEWQRISGWYQDQVNKVRYDDKTKLGGTGVSYLNVRAGYAFKSVEMFTNVMNLTNDLYANSATRGNGSHDRTTFTPAAPRTIVVGIQFTLSGKTNKPML